MSRKVTYYANFANKIYKNTQELYGSKSSTIQIRHFSVLNFNNHKVFPKNLNQPLLKCHVSKHLLDQIRTHHHHECINRMDCWKCGKAINPELEQFLCTCGVLQPPIQSRSFFQVFGFEENFDIDLRKLKNEHQRLQTLLHPDKCGSKSHEERSFAEEHSSMVNEGYSTLQNPLTRGLYLLHINPKNDNLESEIDVEGDFLSEMMELNESIDEHTDEVELIEIENVLLKKMASLVEEISEDFAKGDHAGAKEHLLKMKYLNSAAVRIREIKREQHYNS